MPFSVNTSGLKKASWSANSSTFSPSMPASAFLPSQTPTAAATVTVHDDDASTSRVVKPGLKFALCILRLCLVKICRDNNMQNNVMEEERFKTAVLGMLRAGVVALEYFHLLCSCGDISTDTTTQQIISQPTTSNNPNDEDQQQLLWK